MITTFKNRVNPVQVSPILVKSLIATTLFIASTNAVFASSCQNQQIKAEYQVSVKKPHASSQWQFNLWRNQSQVAHQNLDKQISELWYRAKNDRVQLTRMFDQFNRGIEYQSDEISKSTIDWDKKYQLISASTLNNLTPVANGTSSTGCHRVEKRQGHDGVNQITVEWMPELQLIKQMTIEKPGYKSQWRLTAKSQDSAMIKAQFNQWLHYRTTDYADIGDMENDHFLQKMINMGFSETSHQKGHNH